MAAHTAAILVALVALASVLTLTPVVAADNMTVLERTAAALDFALHDPTDVDDVAHVLHELVEAAFGHDEEEVRDNFRLDP